MLRSFRLANHRSFRDEHELLLMPSYDNDRDVVAEWMYAYPRGRRQLLFERDGRKVGFGSTKVQRAKTRVIEELLTSDVLFLALAARLELHQYWLVFEWFNRSLRFLRAPWIPALDGDRIARFVERAPENREAFLDLARAADV